MTWLWIVPMGLLVGLALGGLGGGVVVRLFHQTEDREGDVGFVATGHFALDCVDAGSVDTAQECGCNHLLLALIDLVELQHSALTGRKEFAQFEIFGVVEDAAVAQYAV